MEQIYISHRHRNGWINKIINFFKNPEETEKFIEIESRFVVA